MSDSLSDAEAPPSHPGIGRTGPDAREPTSPWSGRVSSDWCWRARSPRRASRWRWWTARTRRAFTDAGFDGRVSAISAGSRRVLEALGLWDGLGPAAQAITDIRVTDGAAPAFVHFDHHETGEEPLGHIVENRLIRAALLAAARDDTGVTLVAPATVAAIALDGPAVRVTLA